MTKVFWLGTKKVVLWFQTEINTSVSYFYAPAISARRGHTTFGLSVSVYARLSIDQVKILSKVESQDL